ncbi:MAG: DUF2157 domain-containing protein, partial [Candidatus Obscuribacterales bacterium]|nr:DUF2157 domain-containing protein [Steroidobacteraceae bacterium]
MNRKELDAFVVHHALSRDAIDAALTFARPTAAETRLFLLRAIQLAGVLSLAAGVIFFIAANWSGLAVLGRFALLQSLLVACVTAAWYRPPPSSLGRYALLSAFVLTGALLALFGQSYQTGADVYELFLLWALLALPLVVAAQWSVVWAAWALIVNVTLWLFCGWIPGRHVIWLLLGGWGFTASSVLLAAMLVNVALWIVAERLQRGRFAAQAPQWLNRFLL